MAGFIRFRKEKSYLERKDISCSDSKVLLRFESENVDYLSDHFLGETDETRGGALSSRQRMEIFLRFVSNTGFQTGVAHDFGVHHSTVSKTINSVADSIMKKVHLWIKFPSVLQEMEVARLEWSDRFQIPTVIGALDCTHVRIKKPTAFGDDYINRKGFASLNVQVTCDSSEMITSVSAQWPGSVHDSRIWKQSSVYQIMSRFKGSFCLLGDSGYGISPWLLTPFKKRDNREQEMFNVKHAKERVVIERVFGQLKQRFPLIGHKVKIALEKVPKIVVCCAVLHNISKHLQDNFEFCEESFSDPSNECPDSEHNEVDDLKEKGELKRREIMETLFPD